MRKTRPLPADGVALVLVAASNANSEEGLQSRIDTLLSSALKDKAREERSLFDAIELLKSDIQRVSIELTTLKQMSQRSSLPMLAMLNTKLEQIDQEVTAIPDRLGKTLSASILQVGEVTAEKTSQIHQATREATRNFQDHSARQAEAIKGLAQQQAATSVVGSKVARIEQAIADLPEMLTAAVLSTAEAQTELIKQAVRASAQTTSDLSSLSEVQTDQIKQAVQASAKLAFDNAQKQLQAVKQTVTTSENEVHDHLNVAEEALRGDVETAQEAILSQVSVSSDSITDSVEGLKNDLQIQIGESINRAMRPFVEEVQDLVARLTDAGTTVVESNARLSAIQNSLVDYLRERDSQLETVRQQAFSQILQNMGKKMSGRTQRKVAEALEKAAPGPAAPAAAELPPAWTPPPAPVVAAPPEFRSSTAAEPEPARTWDMGLTEELVADVLIPQENPPARSWRDRNPGRNAEQEPILPETAEQKLQSSAGRKSRRGRSNQHNDSSPDPDFWERDSKKQDEPFFVVDSQGDVVPPGAGPPRRGRKAGKTQTGVKVKVERAPRPKASPPAKSKR